MFEQSVIESRRRHMSKRSFLTFPISIGLHVIVLVGLVVGNVWYVEIPADAPVQVSLYNTATAAPPPPPPPPPPPAPKAAPQEVQKPVEVNPQEVEAVPMAIPDVIPQLEPNPSSGDDAGVEGGVEGGIPGGVAGGVLGGTLGGIVDEGPLIVGGAVQAPKLLKKVEPLYPEFARKARISGVVILQAVITKTGDIQDTRVLKGLHAVLDQAARDAVSKWKYEPATLNGKPVTVYLTITVVYKLQ